MDLETSPWFHHYACALQACHLESEICSRKSSRSPRKVIQKLRVLGNATFCYGSVWGLSLGEGTLLRGPGEDRALVLLDGCMEWKLGAHEDSATPGISGISNQC